MYYVDETTGRPYMKTIDDVILLLHFTVNEKDEYTLIRNANALDIAVRSIIRLKILNRIKEVSDNIISLDDILRILKRADRKDRISMIEASKFGIHAINNKIKYNELKVMTAH